MSKPSRIRPFLWFDRNAEEAAQFYTSIFPNSEITEIVPYPESAGSEAHDHQPGGTMTVTFILDGQSFTAFNGGPTFSFTEAISFVVECADQTEIDHYWKALSEGGPKEAQQCGWLKDRYGISWQIVPSVLPELMTGSWAAAVMGALLRMKKLDIAALEAARESAMKQIDSSN